MPFQPINFASIAPQGNPFARDLVQNLMQSIQGGMQLRNMPGQMRRKAQEEELANSFNQMRNQQEPQRFKSAQDAQELSNVFAGMKNQQEPQRFENEMKNDVLKQELTGQQIGQIKRKLPGEVAQQELSNNYQRLVNQGYSAEQAANIALKNAQAKYYESGGPHKETAGIQEQNNFIKNLMKDNPEFSPQDAERAASAVLSGSNKLEDGRDILVGGLSRNSADKLVKSGTTAQLLNSSVSGARAEAELPVISDYIKKGNDIYPISALGFSPQQISDTTKAASGDKNAIDNLGKYYSSRILQFEQAQLQQLLAGGKTSVSGTQQLMKHTTENQLKQFGVNISAVKNKTLDYVNEATKKAFEQRQKVYGGASSTIIPKEKQSNADSGTTRLYKNGKAYNIPNDKLDKAMQSGYAKE